MMKEVKAIFKSFAVVFMRQIGLKVGFEWLWRYRFERELDTGDENGKCYFYLYWFCSRVFDVLWFWIVSYIAIFIYL